MSDQVAIGHRIRQRRKELGLTLKDVAALSGLSVGFVSHVEREATTPSLSSLVALAGALKASVSYFFPQPSGDAPISRQAERGTYALGSSPRTYERISSSFVGSKIRSLIIHEPPGHRGVPIRHEGEEILIFVLNGALTVEVDGVASVLSNGDALHFPSSKVHVIWNHTDQPATALWVGTMDIFGE